MRLAFMGTPEFALPAFDALLSAGHDIAAVYSQPARRAGRGKRVTHSAVVQRAEALNLPVRTPESLATAETQQAFSALGLDAAVVVAYGLLLPPALLQAPRLGCLNIHASLLPRWRGAAPVERAILAGDRQTGITIMQMDAGLDSGPVLLQSPVEIAPEMTGSALRRALAGVGSWLICRALEGLAAGTCMPRPQPEEGGLVAVKIHRYDRALAWHRPASELARVVRAFAPSPGAWCLLPEGRGESQLKVLQASLVEDVRGTPGEIVGPSLTIACGHGGLRLDIVQRSGRAAMDSDDFLRGHDLPAGTRLPLLGDKAGV